ncbi:hypothetical protein DET49_10238 [Salegentibacter sp. 24]|jgi:hypothetical protein|uniref:hypothetical protein n=1 Tax=Salegentibacter sp. 24 TaxID=2183986 RepID=UPI00105E9D67|nr:hypothetical protein [Salegentibacter sp. 24]TDN95155.1 hypothetical protein DET49_10238 [Salegentibacter sp. 24]
MKNTLYILLLFIGIAITGCEPMEEIHNDIDEGLENVEGSLDYTLVEEDYTENLGLSFPNFSSEDEARELIPVLLSDLYPALGQNSSVNATFNIYDPIVVEEYMVTAADYEAIGLSENYFSGLGDVMDFLAYQFPQAEEGDYVELTYNTLADEVAYMLTDTDFSLIEEELADEYPLPAASASEYGNFERRESNDAYWSNEMILEAVNVVLSENIDGIEGQKYNVSYEIYNGESGTQSMTVQFNGNMYVAVGGTPYELTTDDYDFVGAELLEEYPGPAANAAQYHSFDVNEDSDNYWSMDMLLEAFNLVLNENYPDAADGDKFEVSYDVYSGGVSTRVQALVLENGTYIVDEEAAVSTIEATNVFAYTNGSWNTPLTLEEEDYTAMGQSYPNFDDEDEAIYKLSIFLENQFPYAQEGDFVAVAYNFYSGETTTEYANFVFEDGEFNYIPSVVERSLQFGNDGTEWVPDNTIRYSLSGSDYATIASALADEYPAPVESMGNYSNFDRREGNAAYWSDEMLLEAMRVLLNDIAPNAEVGQQYVMTFDIYNGTNTTESLSLIKNEAGVWVINE